jgi:3-isopropylmalate/(R)-2-methylmalate dehydratase small subunit
MMMQFAGTAHRFGDDINTDYIISSKRKRDTIDVEILKQYIMEDIRPGFFKEIAGGDFIVAGENFGCGSAMEQAAQVIRAANIPAVIAKSFARVFYRNAINNGVYLVECDTDKIEEGDRLTLQFESEKTTLARARDGLVLTAPATPTALRGILDAGGLIPFFRQHGRFIG